MLLSHSGASGIKVPYGTDYHGLYMKNAQFMVANSHNDHWCKRAGP